MTVKLSEILKQQGLFSQDIKNRLKNKQMSINGEAICEDIELDVVVVENKKKDVTGVPFGGEVVKVVDAGIFLFNLISDRSDWLLKIKMFGFEELFDSNIENDLTIFLKKFMFLKTSKKQLFILEKCQKNKEI